jgi:DNA-binding MarR family transcriptional regulator
MSDGRPGAAPEPTEQEVDAVLAASRVLVAVSAQSLVGIDDRLTVPQLRALIAVASRGTLTAAELAGALGVHASGATRLIERLATAGLLDRRAFPADRRYVALAVSARGSGLVDSIIRRRRKAVREILAKLPPRARPSVIEAFAQFAAAGGDPPDRALWSLGWQS